MSRRGNGLSAQSYTPLVDLTPRLADDMLAALREAGVAAYAMSTRDEADGPGEGPAVDRLYVDELAMELAESVLRDRLPDIRDEPAGVDTVERDDDTIWAQIVASYDEPVGAEVAWPEQENLNEADDTAAERSPAARVVKPADAAGDDHFVPPPPPPLPRLDPTTKSAWIALFGGPFYLLVAALLKWHVPGWAAFAAVAAFVGGFVTLVLRMGDDPPRDPDDDGAVV